MEPAADDTLAAALERHNIELADDAIPALDRYAKSLWSWNEKLNLTRHTTYEKFVSRDVADSLWLDKFIDSGDRVLDLGTGGGVPGVILAIARPDLTVSLCDSVAKKAKAVEAIVADTQLPITVHHAPVQDVLKSHQFETIVARAVAPMAKILTWLEPHWDAFGSLLLIKGPAWVEERSEARHRGLLKNLALRKLASYPLPGTESESVVLMIRPEA